MAIARHRGRGTLTVLLTACTAAALALAGCGTDASGTGSAASNSIQVWEGYTGPDAPAFAHLVAEYEAQHPGQKVSTLFVNNDDTLQKVLTAVKGGSPPTSPTSTARGRRTSPRSRRSST